MSYPEKPIPEICTPYEDDYDEYQSSFPDDDDTVDSDGTAAFEKPIDENLIHAEVNLSQGEKIQGAKVIGHTKESNGEMVEKYNDNPLLKSMLYDVQLPDGEKKYIVRIL